jgi:hypothetical protein
MDLLNLLFQSLSASGNQINNKTALTSDLFDYLEELTPEQETEIARDGINVIGSKRQADPRPVSRNPSYTDPPERPEITPRYVLNDDRMPPTEEEMKEIIPRRNGYWGTKGTLRNILGTLSDAFLVQGGGEAEYKNLRDRERMSDAMYGFTDNPQQAMERLAAQGFIKEASALQQNFAAQEQERAALQSQIAARENLANDRLSDNKDKDLGRIARMTASGVPYQNLVALARSRGISEEELNTIGIVPEMTMEQRKQIAAYDMPVTGQMQIPYTERRTRVAEKNADSQRISATRPRAAPRPTQRGLSVVDAEVADAVLSGRATPAQKKYYEERLTRGGKKGRINTPPAPADAKDPASRFRIVN